MLGVFLVVLVGDWSLDNVTFWARVAGTVGVEPRTAAEAAAAANCLTR